VKRLSDIQKYPSHLGVVVACNISKGLQRISVGGNPFLLSQKQKQAFPVLPFAKEGWI